MKKIIYVVFALSFGVTLYSCTNTTDCVCTIVTENNIPVQKASSNVSVTDWDGDCSDITSKDLEGRILEGACREE